MSKYGEEVGHQLKVLVEANMDDYLYLQRFKI